MSILNISTEGTGFDDFVVALIHHAKLETAKNRKQLEATTQFIKEYCEQHYEVRTKKIDWKLRYIAVFNDQPTIIIAAHEKAGKHYFDTTYSYKSGYRIDKNYKGMWIKGRASYENPLVSIKKVSKYTVYVLPEEDYQALRQVLPSRPQI